jgi:hypothetical protein
LLSSSKSAEKLLALVSTQFPGIVILKVTSACEEAGGPTILLILPALIFFSYFLLVLALTRATFSLSKLPMGV